jgi:hypothetical protein
VPSSTTRVDFFCASATRSISPCEIRKLAAVVRNCLRVGCIHVE